jgi:flavin-dependent dehydrogenase
MRARSGEGWALIGDAACFKDPATAHGITDALLDAEALSRSLLRHGTPRTYRNERHEQSRPLFEVTQRITSFDWDFDALKTLHDTLNACMKSEQRAIAGSNPATVLRPRGASIPRRSAATAATAATPGPRSSEALGVI